MDHPIADQQQEANAAQRPVAYTRTRGWTLLRTRDFGLLWMGQIISQIGDGLTKVALIWFVYELTGSTLKTTFIGLLQTIPPLLLGPVIGVYLDYLPKKWTMIWIDLSRAALIVLIPALHRFDALTLTRLYVLVFLIAMFSAAFGPALASSIPLVAPRAHLTAANALIQTAANVGMLAGPAISGLGIALVGAHNVLYLNVVALLGSALCLTPVRIRSARGPRPLPIASLAGDVLVGFRFVFTNPMIFGLMLSSSLYSLAASAFVFLLPALAKSHLGLGPIPHGMLWSAMGIGMLAASVWLAALQQRDFCARMRIVAVALSLGGFSMVGLSLQKSLPTVTGLIVLIGTSMAIFTPIIWAFLQELTPEAFLARVLTTFSTGAMSASMVGMTIFGWVADILSLQASLIGAGTVFLLTALVVVHVSKQYGFPTLLKEPMITP